MGRGVPPLLGRELRAARHTTSNGSRKRRRNMASAAKTGVTTFATPTDTQVVITRVVAAPRRPGLRGLDQSRAHPAVDARPRRLDHAGLRDRPAPRRHLALRLAASPTATRWTMTGNVKEVVPPRAHRHDRALGPRVARDHQHRWMLTEVRRADHDHAHDHLPVEGSARRRDPDRHEGRHGRRASRGSRRCCRRSRDGESPSARARGARLAGAQRHAGARATRC